MKTISKTTTGKEPTISDVARVSGLRVLHLVPAFGTGGAERVIIDTIAGAQRHGISTKLCVFSPPGEIRYEGKFKDCTRYMGFRAPWRDQGAVKELHAQLDAVIDEFKPHLLHTYLWFADYTGAQLSRKHAIPHICHIQSTWSWMSSRRPGFLYRQFVVRRALANPLTQFVACSEAAAQYYRRFMGVEIQRISVFPNSVDCLKFENLGRRKLAPARSGPFRIGTVGRFVVKKGHKHLIDAISQLKAGGVDAQLLIAGDGELREEYISQIKKLGLESAVEFLGEIDDVSSFYASLDAYVHPSAFGEGLSLALLEALAAGCSVIATDVSGTSEALDGGRCGIIVAPQSPTQLAAAIERLVLDSDLRVMLGDQGRDWVRKQYSVDQYVDRILGLYQNLAESLSEHR